MRKFEFDSERIKENARKYGAEVRDCEPGEVGGVYIIGEDGTKREATIEDLFPQPATEEVKRLRCAVADLIGENERLKSALKFIEREAVPSNVSLDLYEINRIAKEALK
ncbi:hypothetical protein R7M47_05410 [Bacillus inaquosorum]|uniref:hypothetical protein n=1 Tax=Bacillus inaquosorum TaxID=483913 RepID=UPI00389A2859